MNVCLRCANEVPDADVAAGIASTDLCATCTADEIANDASIAAALADLDAR